MNPFANGVVLGVVTNSRNPCNGHGSPAQLLLNGTIFITCDPSVDWGMAPADALALGLGLGLGIPGFFLLLWFLAWWNNRRQMAAWAARHAVPV